MAEVSSKCNDKLATGGQNDGDPFLETPSAENKIRTIYSLVHGRRRRRKKNFRPNFTHISDSVPTASIRGRLVREYTYIVPYIAPAVWLLEIS